MFDTFQIQRTWRLLFLFVKESRRIFISLEKLKKKRKIGMDDTIFVGKLDVIHTL